MKVLVADDDLSTQVLLEAMLIKQGFDVMLASDGKQAMDIIQSADPPRLLILDILMPGMNGLEVCRRARELNGENPFYIIMLTVKGEVSDIALGLDTGANDYITKPFDSYEFKARVNSGKRVLELQASLTEKIEELKEALSQIRTLQGILPICMHCHKIRNDKDIWQRLEDYVHQHSGAMFSHGLCPECMEEYYPDTNGTDI